MVVMMTTPDRSGVVILAADASVMPFLGSAAWGGWARGPGRPGYRTSGPLPYTREMTICELRALTYTLRRLSSSGYLRDDDRVLRMRGDNLQALGVILRCVPTAIRYWAPRCVLDVGAPSAGSILTRVAEEMRALVAGRIVLVEHAYRSDGVMRDCHVRARRAARLRGS